MISRVSRVGIAVIASLTVATACFAVDEPGGGPGQGGLGGQIGGSTFALDRAFGSNWFADYSNGASPRMSFDMHWRYTIATHWRAQLGIGFTWSGYSSKHDAAGVPTFPAPFVDPNFPADGVDKSGYISQMVPVSLQIQYLLHRGWSIYHVGVGPGVYRVWIENNRKVVKDPVTLDLHRGEYPGGSAEIGYERFLKGIPAVSLEATITSHLALSQRPEQFVSGFNSNVMATEFRIGGNYYFAPGPRKATAAPPPKSP